MLDNVIVKLECILNGNAKVTCGKTRGGGITNGK